MFYLCVSFPLVFCSNCLNNKILIFCCLWENTDGAEGTIPANVTRVNFTGTLNIRCKVDATPRETNATWFFKDKIIVGGKHP